MTLNVDMDKVILAINAFGLGVVAGLLAATWMHL